MPMPDDFTDFRKDKLIPVKFTPNPTPSHRDNKAYCPGPAEGNIHLFFEMTKPLVVTDKMSVVAFQQIRQSIKLCVQTR
jgi:hypothetical protein